MRNVSPLPAISMLMTLIATVATLSAVAAAALPTAQIAKMWRERSSAAISTTWVLGSLANCAIWNVYSLLLGNLTLIIPNAISLVVNIVMSTVVLTVRHPRFAPATASPGQRISGPVAHFARAVVDDPELGAEFATLVAAHRADRLSTAETLILRPRTEAA